MCPNENNPKDYYCCAIMNKIGCCDDSEFVIIQYDIIRELI